MTTDRDMETARAIPFGLGDKTREAIAAALAAERAPLEARIAEIEGDANTLRKRAEWTDRERLRATAEIDQLRAKLAEAERERDEARAQSGSWRTARDEMAAEVERLRAELTETRRDRDAHGHVAAGAWKGSQLAAAEVERLRAELTETRRDRDAHGHVAAGAWKGSQLAAAEVERLKRGSVLGAGAIAELIEQAEERGARRGMEAAATTLENSGRRFAARLVRELSAADVVRAAREREAGEARHESIAKDDARCVDGCKGCAAERAEWRREQRIQRARAHVGLLRSRLSAGVVPSCGGASDHSARTRVVVSLPTALRRVVRYLREHLHGPVDDMFAELDAADVLEREADRRAASRKARRARQRKGA